MARANLRLVVNIARGYRSTGLALEDLSRRATWDCCARWRVSTRP